MVVLIEAGVQPSRRNGESVLKRVFDVVISFLGLLLASPILLPVMYLVWRQDGHSPFYIAARVARGGGTFKMVKLRSMVVNADRSGVDSTAASDRRITPLGHWIRRHKLDELAQLWNVLVGDMSLVGPRPNVPQEVALYTDEERRLLNLRPGITDFASIVFSDEGDILKGSSDPDLRYHQFIRPWKNRLGLIYVERQGFWIDASIIVLTVLALVNRPLALMGVARLLASCGAAPAMVRVANRSQNLEAAPPPGATEIVKSRQVMPAFDKMGTVAR